MRTVRSMHVATAPQATDSTTVRAAGGGLEESWFVVGVGVGVVLAAGGGRIFILEGWGKSRWWVSVFAWAMEREALEFISSRFGRRGLNTCTRLVTGPTLDWSSPAFLSVQDHPSLCF